MKNQSIDILKLYSGQIKGFEDSNSWNIWLTECRKYQKINDLVMVRNGLQVGMSECAKSKLSNESIENTFCRWIGSIDKTIRKILKDQNYYSKEYKEKKNQDKELELFLRKKSY